MNGEDEAHLYETFTETCLLQGRERRTYLHPSRQLDKVTLDQRGDRLLKDRSEVLNKITESKPILDEIDRVLAAHYGFTDEELDLIINYDIKYRLGRDAAVNEED